MKRHVLSGLLLATALALPAAELPSFGQADLLPGKGIKIAGEAGVISAANLAPSRFCTASFKTDLAWNPELALRFEYRTAASDGGAPPDLVAVNFILADKRMTYHRFDASAEWREAVIPLSSLKALRSDNPLTVNDRIERISIYSRIADSREPAKMALELRNVRFVETAAVKTPQATPAPGETLPAALGADRLQRQKTATATALPGGVIAAVNDGPNRFCTISFKLDNLQYRPDLLLSFEYRNIAAEDGAKPNLTSVNFFDNAGRSTYNNFPVSTEWSKASLKFSALKPIQPGAYGDKDTFRAVNIYSRIADGNPAAKLGLEVRNCVIAVNPDYDPLEGVRVSYSSRPLFDWSKVPGAASYRIEYGPDPGFAKDKTKTAEAKWNFFSPAETLAPGVIYYRVTALPSGKEHRRDQLLIPARSHDWAIPEYNFAKIAATSHPRLLPLALLDKGGDLAALTLEAEKQLDFKVPPNPEPYKEGADPNVRAWIEWYGKIANGVISATGYKLQIMGQAAMITGRDDFRQKARESALAVSRTWDPESGSNMKLCDLQAAHLLRGLGYCLDAAWDVMTPGERDEVAKAIYIRGKQFHEASNPFRGNEAQNHPWDRAQALAFAAIAIAENPESAEWFDFAAKLYAYRFLPSLGFDGENNEGLAYWSYGFGLAVRFIDLANTVAGSNFYTHPYVMRTSRFPLYCAPQAGFQISFADNGRPNHGSMGPVNRPFTRKLAAATGDAEALYYAGSPEAGNVAAKPPVEMAQSVIYPHIGLAVFNTFLADGRENVAVGFHSGKFFAGHQHADQNSFVINAYGDKLAIDGGYYDWWGSKHFYGYSTATAAHNTILVNDKGQSFLTDGADGKLLASFDSPGFGFAAGDASAPKIYNGELKKFERRLLFVKPSLVIIDDRLEAPKPSTFRWLLHSHTQKQQDTAVDGDNFSIIRPLARLDGRLLLPEDAKLDVRKAYDIPAVRGYSVDLEPDPQPEWTINAANPEPAQKLEFLAAMRIAKIVGPAALPEFSKFENAGATGVSARDGGEQLFAIFNHTSGKKVSLAGLDTDADSAAVRLNREGKVVDAMIVNGTFLTFRNKTLIRRAAVGSEAMRKERDIINQAVQVAGLDGKAATFTRYTETLGNGKKTELLTGVITNPADSQMLSLSLEGPGKQQVFYTVSNDQSRFAGSLRAGDAPVEMPLSQGKYLTSFASDDAIGKPVFTVSPVQSAAAKALDASFKLPEGAILIEAESPVSTSSPAPDVVERDGTSGGKISATWNDAGKFAEWDFTVAEPGQYRLLFRAATPVARVMRSFTVDGKAPVGIVSFSATGGFGYGDAEWRWLEVPAPFDLASGKHRLKCLMLDGSANLDCFALIKR